MVARPERHAAASATAAPLCPAHAAAQPRTAGLLRATPVTPGLPPGSLRATPGYSEYSMLLLATPVLLLFLLLQITPCYSRLLRSTPDRAPPLDWWISASANVFPLCCIQGYINRFQPPSAAGCFLSTGVSHLPLCNKFCFRAREPPSVSYHSVSYPRGGVGT